MSRHTLSVRLRAVLLALIGTSSFVSAQEPSADVNRKIDRSLGQSLRRAGTRRVLVTAKSGHRADLRDALRAHGDVIHTESALLDTVAAEVHGEDVLELARAPWVAFVSDDALVYAGGEGGDDRDSDDGGTRFIAKTSLPTPVIWADAQLSGTMCIYSLPAWSVAAQWNDDNMVWGRSASAAEDNIVWGTFDGDNIVWGTSTPQGDNIVWGTFDYDNIVWGTNTPQGDNVVCEMHDGGRGLRVIH
jgi:hypothetical protein